MHRGPDTEARAEGSEANKHHAHNALREFRCSDYTKLLTFLFRLKSPNRKYFLKIAISNYWGKDKAFMLRRPEGTGYFDVNAPCQ